MLMNDICINMNRTTAKLLSDRLLYTLEIQTIRVWTVN